MKSTLALKPAHQSKPVAPLTVANPYHAFTTNDALRGRDISTIAELTSAEIDLVLHCALVLKKNPKDPLQKQIAENKTMAMLFEKPSLRTRVTFEVGMYQLGGTALFLEGCVRDRPVRRPGSASTEASQLRDSTGFSPDFAGRPVAGGLYPLADGGSRVSSRPGCCGGCGRRHRRRRPHQGEGPHGLRDDGGGRCAR